MPKIYTVIGYYEESGLTFAFHVEAESPEDAFKVAVSGSHVDMSCSSDVALVAAIEGAHDVHAPCEDSGNLAYACDLIEEESNV